MSNYRPEDLPNAARALRRVAKQRDQLNEQYLDAEREEAAAETRGQKQMAREKMGTTRQDISLADERYHLLREEVVRLALIPPTQER